MFTKKPPLFIKKYFDIISGLKFRIFITCLSIILISFFLVRNYFDLVSSDPYPNISYYTPQKRAELKTQPVIVKTGFYIRGFSEFDINDNKFVIDGVVWFEFNPRRISLKTIEQFSFERGTILYKSEADTYLAGDKLIAKYAVKVELSTNLDHHLFPLNDHSLFIIIINEFVSPEEVMFTSLESSFGIEKNIYTEGWKLINRKVDYGYSTAELDRLDKTKEDSFPMVIFSVNLKRPGLRQLFLILIPLFVLLYMSLFSLMHGRIEEGSLMELHAAYISSLFFYRFVIEDVAPNVGYYTITDYIYMLVMVNMIIVFLFGLFMTLIAKYGEKMGFWSEFTRENLFLWLQVVTVFVVFFVVRWKPY